MQLSNIAKRHQVHQGCITPAKLPRFSGFFLSKVQTIRHKLDDQAPLCFAESDVAFSLSFLWPVSEDHVRKVILKSSPESRDPTWTLLFEGIDDGVPAITHINY